MYSLPNLWKTGYIAIILTVVVGWWVPYHYALLEPDYYHASLLKAIKPRIIAGTLGDILNLSPQGFILLLQFFSFLWIWLLCHQLFLWLKNDYCALALCIIFTFNSMVYIGNAVTGYVDMVANFWLILAAIFSFRIKPQNDKKTILGLLAVALCLLLSVMTHEKSIFAASVILLWSYVRFGHLALVLISPYLMSTGLFMFLTWTEKTRRKTPQSYIDLIHDDKLLWEKSINLYGILTSIGVLWVIYGTLLYYIIRSLLPWHKKTSYIFIGIAGIVLNLAPLGLGVDTQRMTNNLWLAVFVLIGIAYSQMKEPHTWLTRKGIMTFLCLAQLCIPPVYIVMQTASPLNCYTKEWFSLARNHFCPFCIPYTKLNSYIERRITCR